MHRDISINNIIITPKPDENGRTGFLIDVDLAKEVGSEGKPHAPHRTGTMEFMAIEVLERTAPHTYRHDLESFLYVLIWICIFYDGTGHIRKPRPIVLDGWSRVDASNAKFRLATDDKYFETLLAEFHVDFTDIKGRVRDIRKTLFRLYGNSEAEETAAVCNSMYDSILNILDEYLRKNVFQN